MKNLKNLVLITMVLVAMVLTQGCTSMMNVAWGALVMHEIDEINDEADAAKAESSDSNIQRDSFDFNLNVKPISAYSLELSMTYNYVLNGKIGYDVPVVVDFGDGTNEYGAIIQVEGDDDYTYSSARGGMLLGEHVYPSKSASYTITVKCAIHNGGGWFLEDTITVTVPFL